jgi:hypothetical protein
MSLSHPTSDVQSNEGRQKSLESNTSLSRLDYMSSDVKLSSFYYPYGMVSCPSEKSPTEYREIRMAIAEMCFPL